LNYIGMAALTCGNPLNGRGTEAQCHTISQLDPTRSGVLQCGKLAVSIQPRGQAGVLVAELPRLTEVQKN